ncbi:ABC transporter substrate-binding protein [Sulfitobacter sp. M57]|uniref:ABC transporter substrate-binding protein n=1 Tax=unclassified Sulfitobacter TaxID=196795 RepID=UPI0023E2F224|nr:MULTISPECIES: ABC transporter substrate-binding protein [unclassified Sulfitobacter]MDF3416546.1 ABC transporter substrate-binding protein [Sulfitobacter sp. KE5]MDF3424014.1 ABC transporter substrate-binding protein [Sulfitobacter sp. KE43]MDF3435000.1 ABC transporter substrate-binding protein [Sulfitobacter sp. KE42]MDF3460681.1 ABC transporter substrate-binding protein [Sulfitobacter sp. S74]MDF3464635.1 ABC transporter substrate-binding protein [Sulfitobacter sp. Ks18]
MFRFFGILMAVLCGLPAWAETAMNIGYLHVDVPRAPTLSNLDPIPADNGLAGAQTGLQDNQTTGKFLGQTYTLEPVVIPVGDDPLAAARQLLASSPFLVLNAPAEVALAIADMPAAQGALLFNASAGDISLRDEDCRSNLFHSLPSDGMRADALAQVLVQKRWTDLVMISGTHAIDLAYATAMRRALTKFGLALSGEKTWDADADMRRTASQEIPLFTQGFGDYDALIVIDELHDFGRYVLYNTWQARPVIGSEGLSALTWAPVIEQWGAAQLQSRFEEQHGRKMKSVDYAAWAAVRTLGEAVTRTNASDPATLRAYILSDAFELAGFKGRALTYRDWNGQLRQPIAIAHPRALVAQAPLEGFLHQTNELDSLGLDRPESRCEAYQ